MAIEKHTTSCIVIDMYESGEHDMKLKLYTRDFGMIYASSASLKKSAKLRPHLIKGRVSDVTLVKGKEIYRLAGARESHVHNGPNVKTYISLINRFIHGELKNSRLYDRLISYGLLDNVDQSILRLAITSELLIVLGYINTDDLGISIDKYINMDIEDFILHISLNKKATVHSVKNAIELSML